MSSLPAIHLPRPAFHLPPRTILAVAVSIVAAALLIAASTVTVLDRDPGLHRAADDTTRVTVLCDLPPHRDAWWDSDDPTPNFAVTAPCRERTEPRLSLQRGMLPVGRKPAAWYLGSTSAVSISQPSQ